MKLKNMMYSNAFSSMRDYSASYDEAAEFCGVLGYGLSYREDEGDFIVTSGNPDEFVGRFEPTLQILHIFEEDPSWM